jgi:uncharacterized protein (DUF2236 family)
MAEAAEYVTPAHLEDLLAQLAELPGPRSQGFFGPQSITWQVNREAGVFLGAGRAALLQLAHPWVATALAQHSNLLHDAIGRFHSTFRVVYTMIFGNRDQALQASRQLYDRHTAVRGKLPMATGSHARGQHYEANEVAALRWVYATLVESAVLAYELVLPPLAPADREQYYQESKRMAALFGIPAASLPRDWSSFASYVAEMLNSDILEVNATSRALGHSVLSGAGTSFQPPDWYRALTASWLPRRLRTAFALTYTPRDRARTRRIVRLLPSLYASIPAPIHFVGPFHEAQARLRGLPPGLLTRRSNQFWMGQPRLLFPQD